MNSPTLIRQRAELSSLPRRARGAALGKAGYLPGSDVLLVVAAALLAVSVFELAAWLASAPLATLVYSVVACVPLVLFFAAMACERQR